MPAQGQRDPDDIIELIVKEHKYLVGFKNNPRLEFEVYKLTIETIFTTLKNEKKLRTFPLKSLKAYEEGLGEIAGRFFDLYKSPIGHKLKRQKIQPLIEAAYKKLSSAISLIQGDSISELKGSSLDKCLGYIMLCRSKLFELDEYLKAVQFDKT